MGSVLNWCRLFRWQTAPATIVLVLVPYLAAGGAAPAAVALGALAWVLHGITFGHNSLMDTAMGFDRRDPSKRSHPLVAGRVPLESAHKVIHWGLGGLAVAGILVTRALSPDPFAALAALFLFFIYGIAYNSGLAKVSLLGFLPISICFTALGAWGWLLASPDIGAAGAALLGYFFLTILFQISWSGHLKEMGVKERGNLLIRLGAKLHAGWFCPNSAKYYGYGVKAANLALGAAMLYLAFSWQGLASLILFGGATLLYLRRLTMKRVYLRNRELMNMSVMEIATIYLPILIVVPVAPALALMVFGVAYFFGANKLLWDASHPRV